MSFGFRVGPPGFKVRVSTRGVRTSIGPRAARVSFGSGRTRVSSGFGPFFASTSLGGGSRRSISTRRAPNRAVGPSAAQLARAERAAERARQDAERDAAIERLTELRWQSTTVHLQDFAMARQPVINAPPPLPSDWVEAQATAHRLQGIGIFARSERSAAKERARHDASAYAEDELRRLNAVYRHLQRAADQWWAELSANDELTVCEAVNTAFSDNPAAGCAVGVKGSTLSIVMRQQDIDSLPGQTPGLTSAGRATLKSLTKKDRVGWWLTILSSNLVATLKEAFAVAPGITDVSVAVLSRVPDTMRLGVVAFGTWTRTAIDSASWSTPGDALRILDLGRDVACSVRTTTSGALSTAVKPLDVDGIPGLQSLLDENAVDDGSDNLGEFDNALAANQVSPDSPHGDTHPYALTPFAEWLAARDRTDALVAAPASRQQRLVAGQTLVLSEQAIFEAQVTFSYRMRTRDADADLAIILLELDGKVGNTDDFVFYNQPATADQSVRLARKVVDSGAVTERGELHLSMLPPRVVRVLVALSMDTDGGLSCGAIDSITLAVTSGDDVWLFHPDPDSAIKAMIGAEFYRHHGPDGWVWKLRAVGQGWAGGLAELAQTHGIDVD